jgi:hypothetical protein
MNRILKFRLVVLLLSVLFVLSGCSQRAQDEKVNSNAGASAQVNLNENLTDEENAYKEIKDKTNAVVYKPSELLGYTFEKIPPADYVWKEGGDFSGVGGDAGFYHIWYKKGNSYLEVFGGYGCNGEYTDNIIGTLNDENILYLGDGEKVVCYPRSGHAYGVRLYGAKLLKEDALKIMNSMKKIE